MASADFVNSVYQAALQLGIPETQARLAASQAALETRYGKSAPGNNYFGIKGKGQTLKTKEASNGALSAINDSFRTYPDLPSSILGWYHTIQRNFPEAATATDFGTAINALDNGRYGSYATDKVEANDPLTYQDKLASINSRYLGGTPRPPADVPNYTVHSGDTLGKIASRFGMTVKDLAQANGIADPNKIRAGATLRLPSAPPALPTTFGGRLPAQAQYGIDRLVPGQVTKAPTDFTTQPTGAPDLRTLGMAAPPVLPRGLPMAGGALPSIAQMGLAAAGGAAGGVAPAPMPGRPPALTAAPPAPFRVQPPQLPAQRPRAPVAPAPVQLRLASGKTIAPGIYNQGDHSVQVSDAGDGTARITTIHGPGAIPGVMDPLREVNAHTIAGGMIRSMLPKMATDAMTGFAPQVDNARNAAVNAASGLGGAISGFGGNLMGGLGGLFGQHPSLPHPFNLLGGALQQRAPVPQNRPSIFSMPQRAPQHQTRQQANNDLRESGMLDQFGMIR